MNYNQNGLMHTYTGRAFDFANMRETDVHILDIAVSLSRTMRYRGHTEEAYSVAQHSVLCCEYAPPDFKLEALLHDAHEAYTSDVVRPAKFKAWKEFEAVVESHVRKSFGLPERMSLVVKSIDDRMLATEKRDLIPPGGADWGLRDAPYSGRIIPWTAETSLLRFLRAFYNIRDGIPLGI